MTSTALASKLLVILLVATIVWGIMATAAPNLVLAGGPGSLGDDPDPDGRVPGGLSREETMSGKVWLTLVRCLLLVL